MSEDPLYPAPWPGMGISLPSDTILPPPSKVVLDQLDTPLSLSQDLSHTLTLYIAPCVVDFPSPEDPRDAMPHPPRPRILLAPERLVPALH